MSDSEVEDPYYDGGYNSDEDREYNPSNSDYNDSSDSVSDVSSFKENGSILVELERETSEDNIEREQVEQNEMVNVLMENLDADDAQSTEENKVLTRKRKRVPEQWKCNVRKMKRERDEEYISSRNKIVPAKEIKLVKDCAKNCLYKCSAIISKEEQQEIFNSYYTLNKLAKRMFIIANCEVCVPTRRRKEKNIENSTKKNTIKYFFVINERKVRVCKIYFLATLDVSQKTIYNAINNRNSCTNTPTRMKHGNHSKNKTLEEAIQAVKEHINSFPWVQSHYCRSDSQREYLEGNLSLVKICGLYFEQMTEKNASPVKLSQYRYIFCNNFNIYFFKPKKDRCNVCELQKLETAEGRDDRHEEAYLKHIKQKESARQERKTGRENKDRAVVTFDLQNVLSCPKAEISSFYYKTKLSVYNLTAYLSINGQVYCALWPEVLMGRKGNDIASALVKILKRIIADHPNIEELTLWSDSCVPQNRNCVISYAIAHLIKQSQIEKVTLKYSTPGHSCVQEIDSVHSVIERVLNKVEYYSPISLLRILLKVNSRKPYIVLQMQRTDFFDYQTLARYYNYNEVPFTKVSVLQIVQNALNIMYKTSHEDQEFKIINIKRNTRTAKETIYSVFSDPKISKGKVEFSAAKKEAIKTMLPYMPKIDQEYFKTVIPNVNITKLKQNGGKASGKQTNSKTRK